MCNFFCKALEAKSVRMGGTIVVPTGNKVVCDMDHNWIPLVSGHKSFLRGGLDREWRLQWCCIGLIPSWAWWLKLISLQFALWTTAWLVPMFQCNQHLLSVYCLMRKNVPWTFWCIHWGSNLFWMPNWLVVLSFQVFVGRNFNSRILVLVSVTNSLYIAFQNCAWNGPCVGVLKERLSSLILEDVAWAARMGGSLILLKYISSMSHM